MAGQNWSAHVESQRIAADYDVIILGGGCAGLACYEALRAQDLRCAIVESKAFLGGRVRCFAGAEWAKAAKAVAWCLPGGEAAAAAAMDAAAAMMVVEEEEGVGTGAKSDKGPMDRVSSPAGFFDAAMSGW